MLQRTVKNLIQKHKPWLVICDFDVTMTINDTIEPFLDFASQSWPTHSDLEQHHGEEEEGEEAEESNTDQLIPIATQLTNYVDNYSKEHDILYSNLLTNMKDFLQSELEKYQLKEKIKPVLCFLWV